VSREKPHAIGDIAFHGQMSSVRCACGWTAGPMTPAELQIAYQGHRRDLGLNATSAADMGVTGEGTKALRVR
jgi:hypothetical protein